MQEMMKKMYDKAGPKVVENLNKRRFEAYYVSTAEEAEEKVLSLIPKEHVVSWGGTTTMAQLRVQQRLKEAGYSVIDRDAAQSPAEKKALMKKALLCDTFLMSANAVSADGQLVNIDGGGNRVAALCYGPDSVIVVAGMNKVAPTLETAVSRARNVAAPANAQRFPVKTPCNVNGLCSDCISPDCICAQVVVTRVSSPAGRIKVILVGEDLGF